MSEADNTNNSLAIPSLSLMQEYLGVLLEAMPAERRTDEVLFAAAALQWYEVQRARTVEEFNELHKSGQPTEEDEKLHEERLQSLSVLFIPNFHC